MRIVIAAATLLVAGCGGDAGEKARLSGRVEVGPTPGPCLVDRPCSRPAGEVELVFTRPGDNPIRTTTDERGRYSVEVEPGTYRTGLDGQSAIARLYPTRVRVVGHTRRDLQIDSGIRSPRRP